MQFAGTTNESSLISTCTPLISPVLRKVITLRPESFTYFRDTNRSLISVSMHAIVVKIRGIGNF